MEMGLRGVVALVTASSEGIGKAIAVGLAREGATLTICARRTEVLEATAREISEATGAEILALPCDVTEAQAPENLVSRTVERFGRLDVLVSNAGGPPHGLSGAHDD